MTYAKVGWVWKVFGDINRYYVCVFEVKVSRPDFLNTFGERKTPHSEARLEPVGTAHWVVAEKGICKPEELPDFWGLLTPYGVGLSERKMPKLNILKDSELHAMAFDMLWLSMNFRTSFYDQLIEMARKIQGVHDAIVRDKPKEELLKLAAKSRKACRGLAF